MSVLPFSWSASACVYTSGSIATHVRLSLNIPCPSAPRAAHVARTHARTPAVSQLMDRWRIQRRIIRPRLPSINGSQNGQNALTAGPPQDIQAGPRRKEGKEKGKEQMMEEGEGREGSGRVGQVEGKGGKRRDGKYEGRGEERNWCRCRPQVQILDPPVSRDHPSRQASLIRILNLAFLCVGGIGTMRWRSWRESFTTPTE